LRPYQGKQLQYYGIKGLKLPLYIVDSKVVETKKATIFVKREKEEILSLGIKLIILDEISTINEDLANDIFSFGIPVLGIGDGFQLDAIGKNYFKENLANPDVLLKEIHRQNLDNPIIRLSMDIRLEGRLPSLRDNCEEIKVFDYDNLTTDTYTTLFNSTDISLTLTNEFKNQVNDAYRTIKFGSSLPEYPIKGEQVICRKNSYNFPLTNGEILKFQAGDLGKYLVSETKFNYMQTSDSSNLTMLGNPLLNGTLGTLLSDAELFKITDENAFLGRYGNYEKYKYQNYEKFPEFLKIDFKPYGGEDVEYYEDVIINRYNLDNGALPEIKTDPFYKVATFNYGYTITCHSAQGSEFNNVLVFYEEPPRFMSKLNYLKWWYTAITRARNGVQIVL